MKIRRYLEADWNRLCEIHDRARADELRNAGLAAAFLPLETAAEKEGLFDYDVLVAETQSLVTGFLAFNREELAWLYVAPDCYRSGTGKRLVNAALEARPEGLSVEVLQGNTPALNFYRSMGFVESGVTHGQMPANEQYTVTVHCLTYRRGAGDRSAG